MSDRADELFTKNFLKFVTSEGAGTLRLVSPEDAPRLAGFQTVFRREMSRKLIFFKDERRVPDVGVALAHRVDSSGFGIVVSTTGFMIVEKELRADFIAWYDALDLMDHFSKESRPDIAGWLKCGMAFAVLYFAFDSLSKAQVWSGSFSDQLTGAGWLIGALLLFAIAIPSSLWAIKQIFGPKILFFGDQKRYWTGAWLLDRDKLFDCLRRGALTWEKANTAA